MRDLKFDFNDIVLIPDASTDIKSRSECKVTKDFEFTHQMLPLMAAPMDTVVCEKNHQKYIDAGIIPCIR